jgi:hypothetical protein
MQACVEHARPLQKLARGILRDMGVDKPKLPKHPEKLYGTIGAYRNAFAHDPVLGRAADQGRDLLPPQHRLPKVGSPMLWRDAATIPAAEMIDGLTLEEDLWQRLAEFLQAQWAALTEEFIEARKHDKFIGDLGLNGLLPIRCAPSEASLAGPVGASGTIIIARSVGANFGYRGSKFLSSLLPGRFLFDLAASTSMNVKSERSVWRYSAGSGGAHPIITETAPESLPVQNGGHS